MADSGPRRVWKLKEVSPPLLGDFFSHDTYTVEVEGGRAGIMSMRQYLTYVRKCSPAWLFGGQRRNVLRPLLSLLPEVTFTWYGTNHVKYRQMIVTPSPYLACSKPA
jgi:hypothetical protein